MNELFQNVNIYEHVKIPDGYVNIRETEREIVALDFEKFINTKYLNLVTNIDHEEWKTLIQYAKISNKLSQLRTFVTQMKNEAIQHETTRIKDKFDFQYGQQRDAIVAKIVDLQTSGIGDPIELNTLRTQLHAVSDQTKIEQLEYIKYVNLNLHRTHQY
ncbi:unnamed protein product [Rotaria sp. Silwood1]|nr:unnamed protein product [Rotaria sp. Silwood1]CAF4948996.1 unnamed protein product [Rotaria sp. Silwood1]